MRAKRFFYCGLFTIALLSIAVRLLVIDVPPFQSDESVNVYAAYAIAKGALPYREIALSHPPLGYLVCSAMIRFSGNSIGVLRASVTVLFSLSLLIEALLAKELFTDMFGQSQAEKIGLIAALLSAVFPGSLAFTMTVYLEVFLLLFTLCGILLFLLALRKRSTLLMILSGSLFGLAVFTKFVAVFPTLSLIVLLTTKKTVFDVPRKRAIASFMVGLVAVSLGIIAILTGAWGALSQFLQQSLIFQVQLRPPFSLSDKLGTLAWYLDAFSPLLVLAAFGDLILITEFRDRGDIRVISPMWMYALPIILQLFVVGFWFHHLIYLTPLLLLVATLPIADELHLFRTRRGISNRKVLTVALIAVVIYYSATGISNPHRISPYLYSHDPSSYTQAERIVGSKVSELTNKEDVIWTSEGAIAFFADRLIVTPDSEEWPVAGFFDFWLGKTLMGNNGSGLVAPSEFEASWERQRPKVLVFIRNAGWVTYPDELMWSGYDNAAGVDAYVLDHYSLYDDIQVQANPYSYEVWLKNG